MELKIVEKDEKTALVEVKGETFTLTNLIKDILWDDPNVKEAADIKDHPYLDEPKIWVRVEKGSPFTALKKASAKAEKEIEELEEKLRKALKG